MTPRSLAALCTVAMGLAALITVIGLWRRELDANQALLAMLALVTGLAGGQVLRGGTSAPPPPPPSPPTSPASGPAAPAADGGTTAPEETA